ncbi:winged helix-turn-helix domain-containing protein [Ferrimonas aestuarii]|uniref:OmpR/PhoB-type domain-containing protein n=1 Tax=Ferrimonas aestuarii TaxID=2569539 RepID=A0A4U1BQB9_9GAMM|nr:winged helix-turn-helix domain-containing protein [Ferrimonas aestuarii]TKB56170.1 hypothetical protein FCL42_08115 [Ferrimonas aestuarii]
MGERVLLIGEFKYFPKGKLVIRPSGKAVRLKPICAAFLEVLLASPKSLVSYDQLYDEVWPRRVVGHSALRQVVKELRKAFKDNHQQPKFIQTHRSRGYQWLVAPQEALQPMNYSSSHWFAEHWRHIGVGGVMAASVLFSITIDVPLNHQSPPPTLVKRLQGSPEPIVQLSYVGAEPAAECQLLDAPAQEQQQKPL